MKKKRTEVTYANRQGFLSNMHPLNELISAKDKIDFLTHFAEIMEGARTEKQHVSKVFHRMINLLNSSN